MEDATVSQARQENFLFLYREFRERRMQEGEPDRGTLKAFAELLDMSDRYLSHVKCGRKPIGHAIARQIEQAFKLPQGWMDRRHTELDPASLEERDFIDTMLSLFRSSPAAARRLMVEAVKERLGTKKQ